MSVHNDLTDKNFKRTGSPEKSKEMAERLASLWSSFSACMSTPHTFNRAGSWVCKPMTNQKSTLNTTHLN